MSEKLAKAMALLSAKMAAGNSENTAVDMLLGSDKPDETVASVVADICLSDPETAHKTLAQLVRQARARPADALVRKAKRLKSLYEKRLEEMQRGGLRLANYVGPARFAGLQRVEVRTIDGQTRFPMLAEHLKVASLARGCPVLLDSEGAVVLGAGEVSRCGGQLAEFQRSLSGNMVELKLQHERFVMDAAQPLLDALQQDQVQRGDLVSFCPRRELAFTAIPQETDRRFRFMDTANVPDVVAQRDIGRPHASLAWLVQRTEILTFREDLIEEFDMRRRVTIMMVGPSGTGKTLTIKAFLRSFYEMLQRKTGRRDVESRVVRAKVAELLSEWFGRSDKNIEEFVDDIKTLAATPVATADGQLVSLPVVVVLEECEGLARRRGDYDGGGVYDRVIGTLLQRLDDPTDDLARYPIIIIATSNRPDMIDVAMWRRLAGVVARFGRLDQDAFHAVLAKKIKPDYRFAAHNGDSAQQLRHRLLDQVVATMYSPSIDGPCGEITMRDGTKLAIHPRHFLTGAIVEQAVSDAIDRTVFAALRGDDQAGLSAGVILDALERQVDSLMRNMTPHNAGEYVDLPDNARVADVRLLARKMPALVDSMV